MAAAAEEGGEGAREGIRCSRATEVDGGQRGRGAEGAGGRPRPAEWCEVVVSTATPAASGPGGALHAS